jgi:hypothetical protein
LLPNGRLEVIPGGTHTLNYAMPDRFAAAIRPFLLESRSASRRRQPVRA